MWNDERCGYVGQQQGEEGRIPVCVCVCVCVCVRMDVCGGGVGAIEESGCDAV